MQVTINGEARSLDETMTIRYLIETLGLNPETIAVERNREIVKRSRFDDQLVEDGDRIELVEFVGGG